MNMYNLDFSKSLSGVLPPGWSLNDFSNKNAPRFALENDAEGSYLSLRGGGDPLVNAYISAKIKLEPGTYKYEVQFSMTEGVNPHQNLLFQFRGDTQDGIFKFYRLDDGMVEGRDTAVLTGKTDEAELRIYYRYNPRGEVKLRSLCLSPVEPVKPRWARFACTSGKLNCEKMVSAATRAAEDKADLLLYPETVSQKSGDATGGDALLELLPELAAKHRIYTAASILVVDKNDGHRYNRGVVYDRQGSLLGVYDKIHPYSPEATDLNISPGNKTEIFKTDFGKIGMIICYDSWFTDITQLLALKGAEVILFPVAGYYRSLIPARAADNGVRFVISVLEDQYGIFDSAGRDVQDPDRDPTVRTSGNTFRDVKTFDVDGIGMLCASLDLNCNVSPHFNGGKMQEAPGGKRSRAEQIIYLEDLIKKERERWWELE